MTRKVNAPDTEPEQQNFLLPSENIEHLLQVVDYWPDDINPDIIIARIEVVGGPEEGRSILHRVDTNDQSKGFYYTRMFLKALGESYKGAFVIEETNWPGKQFFARIVHNKSKDGSKTYANISEYNFDKLVAQVKQPSATAPAVEDVAWDEVK